MYRAVFLLALLLAGCGGEHRKVIVIGVDGMDPGFVERHWADLPNLDRLRQEGSFERLATTTPPQSPVAWSTFITGLDPAEHGIFDFVHRDPATGEPFLSTDRTVEPKFVIPLGPWRLPLTSPRIESLRKGKPFWQTLSERGVPVMVVRMPTNYPPLPFGQELSGMGTPDLRGTQGTYTWYSGEPGNHVAVKIEGPANALRQDRLASSVQLDVDVDPERPVARLAVGDAVEVVRQGEWSGWMPADFPLIPHLASVRGMFRVYAKQLRPRVELYISPVNIDPQKPALPISRPESFAKQAGRFYTQGIAEDTIALRQGVFTHEEFLGQSRLVLNDELMLLRHSLDRYRDGFLFFYFSVVDQNSHILWGRHDAELLEFYRAVDTAIGEVRRREPGAVLMVMSDHGFAAFDHAVNLNTWFVQEGFAPRPVALGLNGIYLNGADRDEVRRRLLALEGVKNVTTGSGGVAPDLVVGYRKGYRASWDAGLGRASGKVLEDNTDAWIADHCMDAADVPGVLFLSRGWRVREASLRGLSGAILDLY